MAYRTSLRVLLSLSWLACRPLALKPQALAPGGSLISIAGRAKCGTSHLYNLLSSHPDVFSLQKEECPGPLQMGGGHVQMDEDLFAQYLAATVSRAQAEDGSWLRMEDEEVRKACVKTFGLNSTDMCEAFYQSASSGGSANATKVLQSCINPSGVARMQNLAPVANARVLFVLRDPADLLWSAYNFWTRQMDAPDTLRRHRPTYNEREALMDEPRTAWPWTNTENFRSPDHFHELVASEGRLIGGVPNWRNYLELPGIRGLMEAFGRDQVLLLRSEDMHLRDTIQRLFDFVGLDINGIRPELIDARTNSQGSLDGRGIGSTSFHELPGRYEVSGFQPMLCETRKLIYDQARGACVTLDEEFGLRYPACLGSAPACPDDR